MQRLPTLTDARRRIILDKKYFSNRVEIARHVLERKRGRADRLLLIPPSRVETGVNTCAF
jgi:hypothetical protein